MIFPLVAVMGAFGSTSWAEAVYAANYPAIVYMLEDRVSLTDGNIELGMRDPDVFEMMLLYDPTLARHHPGPDRYPMSIKIWVTTFTGQNMPNMRSNNWPTFIRKCRALARAGGDLSEPQPFQDNTFGLEKGLRLEQLLEHEVSIDKSAERFLKEFRALVKKAKKIS